MSGSLDRSGEPTMRRRTSSRASIPLSTSAGSSSPKLTRHPSNVGTSAVRPPHRTRTLSLASSHSLHAASTISGDLGTSTSSFFPDLLRDTSQKKLEKILQSRLVESFITVTLLPSGSAANGVHPSTPNGEHVEHIAGSPSSSRPSSPSRPSKDKAASRPGTASKIMPRRGTVGAAGTSPIPRSPTTPTKHGASASMSAAKGSLAAHGKSASVSLSNGKTPKSPSTPQKARFPTSSASSQVTPASSTLHDTSHAVQVAQPQDDSLPVPDYISPIHWPSTNPVFQLSRDEFAPGTDLSGAKMRVEVWGRLGQEGTSTIRSMDSMGQPAKGKGKEKQLDGAEGDAEWKVLESWEVTLNELKLLPAEVSIDPNLVAGSLTFCSLRTTLRTCHQTPYLFPSQLGRRSTCLLAPCDRVRHLEPRLPMLVITLIRRRRCIE